MNDQRQTTAADKLRAWINGDRDFAWAQPNSWLDEALAEARQPDSEALREAAQNLVSFCDIEVPYWADMPGQQERWHEYIRLLTEARAALAALPPSAPPCTHAEGCICIEAAHASCCGVLREQTLAGLSAPPALDVERLHRALLRAMANHYAMRGTHPDYDARNIAAEYARLASQPPAEPTDDDQ